MKRFIQSVTAVFLIALIAIPAPMTSAVATSTINFSGYTWNTKSGHAGPGPNDWDNSSNSLFTDASGALHMKVSNVNGGWKSSELYLPKSLGYGTYRFEVLGRPDLLDENLVLGMFLYQDDTHEIDIEYSRWGYTNGTNMGYSVQPYATPGNNKSLNITLRDDIPTIHEIIWKPTSIDFRISQNGVTLSEWSYTGANNFVPGREILDINFWMFNGKAPSDGKPHEVVIKNFSFSGPSTNTPPVITPPAPVVIAPTPTTPSVEKPQVTKKNLKKKKFKAWWRQR